MHGARVQDEVQPGPREPGEEFARQHVALQAVTSRACRHEVAGDVGAAVSDRMDVVESREVKFQRRGAVHTPPAAVAHGGALDRPLLGPGADLLRAPGDAGGSGKGYAVKVTPS